MSCFGGHNEQIYLLEILIDKLILTPDKIKVIGEYPIVIKIKLLDFPVFEFTRDDWDASKRNQEMRFMVGKCCLFVKRPRDLVQELRSSRFKLGVFRANETYPTAEAELTLPGCLCDQISMLDNDSQNQPKPFIMKKGINLVDPGKNPCGSISMGTRLSCFGSSIINHLMLREKSFILRGFPLGWKLSCTKLSDKSENNERYMKKCDNNTSLLYKILDPTYSKLYNQDDRTETESVLTRPESSFHISMNQPGFEKLTSTEKLNNHKYHGLIYEIYHNEPTCSCLPTDRSTHPMCRFGCVRSCCMSLRNPDSLKKFPSLATLASDNFYLKSDMEQNVTCHDSPRLRGGEDTEDNYLNNKASWDEGYTWHDNDINLKNRIMGGSDYDASARALSEAPTVMYEESKRTGVNLPFSSQSRTADGIKGPDCTCPGNVSLPWKTNAPRCSKKPCVGADCMIRAFKEVQEFVDSLGKVPGMKGLGLMDPSESPYFGRDIQWDYTVQEIPSEKKRGYPISASPVPTVQCPAPCNTQIGKPIASTLSAPYVASSIMTAVPGRSGVVREAIPSLPETTSLLVAGKLSKKKEDKKEEKLEKQKELDVTTSAPLNAIDVGPCGEPKCKSRRKKKYNNQTMCDNEVSETKPIQTLLPGTIAAKAVGKLVEKGRYPKGKPGPSGDRDRGPIKVSKRVMRYVYSIGDVYPGTNYGHKNCIDPRFRVPANMGWLWNTTATAGKFKPRIGWRPGAIGRYVNEMLKEAKGATMEDYRAKSIPSRDSLRRGKVYKSISYVSQVKKESEEDAEPPPTLHIHRKDGTYYVTMYPIRQETTAEVSQLEEPMKPLQFKIVRNKDDTSVASSSTASDMEIEFSPPAAVNRYRKKPDVIHVDTQVRQQEILNAFKVTDDTQKTKEKKGKRERKAKK
ncbi:PREDICTED: uncharacterized protein LOC105618392 [Atta cephalotes]|uniref:DUF4776 domain-containing protein n=1 Tax=Atta cephalotes TaxID=12957 RepID=A0A158NCR6_ATTCE|nr:PREDICTED: uncharacterized protein LOC105618392 [Atta cephalotes]